MLSKYMSGKSAISAFGFGLFLVLVLLAIPVYSVSAQPAPQPASSTSSISASLSSLSPQTILANIQSAVPKLTSLVTALAYVLGIFMVITGIMQLKHAGEMRTQMSHEHNLGKPLLIITIGALLIYLPSSVQVGMSTFWSNPNPYGYITQSDQWQQAINVCFAVIQFIGVVSFIRGLILLSHVGGGGHQGAFSKGITHVIGGIFCINIYQFVQVIMATLGIQS